MTTSAFPADDGLARPATRRALAEGLRPGDQTGYLRAVAALCADRLLVPVVATRVGESAITGSDKEAEMAVVLLQAADGRRAMLAFTGTDSLAAWDATARPVPVTLDLAAQSAVADGAAALLIDLAGPHPLVIDGEVLSGLAQGRRLLELDDGGFGWAVVDKAEAEPDPRVGAGAGADHVPATFGTGAGRGAGQSPGIGAAGPGVVQLSDPQDCPPARVDW